MAYESWGRYPKAKHQRVQPVYWRNSDIDLSQIEGTMLPYGYGRSYGDSCLNDGGTLLDVTPLNRYVHFDRENGSIRCEAGVQFAELLKFIVPQGWFLPTTPGTKFVSVGGAIANDVHGKNHHLAGTFGCHVSQLELLRSNGERLICSPESNSELFRATIGGLGLTGLILWAEFKLCRIDGPYIEQEKIRFTNIDEFFEISQDSDEHYRYTVSWIDCLSSGPHLGRGILMRGNHAWMRKMPNKKPEPRSLLAVPVDFPPLILNTLTMKAFNEAYYRAQLFKHQHNVILYDSFFYPLDAIKDWNKIYGTQGFLQYQLVVPHDKDGAAIKQILRRISASTEVSFLAVLKVFGDVPSPGMLSFPRPGVTLALDFPYRGAHLLRFLDGLDQMVREVGGAIYPAKDARMSPAMFEASFPNWREFAQYVDPKFSSSFWRRVTGPLLNKQ